MKQPGEQFHPSRDVHNKPPEYELPFGGNEGVHITGSGYYEKGELEAATESDRSYGDTSSPLLQPAQGRLFDADKHEAAQRQKLGRARFEIPQGPLKEQTQHVLAKGLQQSVIPTSHLQSRAPGIPETKMATNNGLGQWEGSGVAGWYNGPSTKDAADVLAVDPNSMHGASDTFIHEAGHRRHLGELPAFGDYTNHPRVLGGSMRADPLKEGVADAYVDRYGGDQSRQVRPMREDVEAGAGQKFTSYGFTGYTTDRERTHALGWQGADRALYAAVRGHASETGEQPLYDPRGRHVMEEPGIADYGSGNPTVDATLHGLLSSSPHAAQALRQTGLKEEGSRAFRRHRDRQLLTQGQEVQGALFHELKGVSTGKIHGYTPNIDAMPEATNGAEFEAKFEGMHRDIDAKEQSAGEMLWPNHMSHNQFGEAPRSALDVGASLGVGRKNALARGFTAL